MTDAPKRFYVHDSQLFEVGVFVPHSNDVEVVRADLFDSMTAERDAALALVAAAYEAAAEFVRENLVHGSFETVVKSLRSLTPADAIAAQAVRDARMRAEGAAKAEARVAKLRRALTWLVAACTTGDTDGKGNPIGVRTPEKAAVEVARAALQEDGDE